MSLLDTVVGAIAIANGITKPFQGSVQHWSWTGTDGFGTDTFSPPLTSPGTPRAALVDLSRKMRTDENGRMQMTVATLTILDVLAPNGASGRVEPIDVRDRIVLPDGTTGPIIRGGGFMNPLTGRPLSNEIMLGEL